MWGRGSSAAAGALARYRERARAQERIREARLAEANRQAGTRPPRTRRPRAGGPASLAREAGRPRKPIKREGAVDFRGECRRGGAARNKVRNFATAIRVTSAAGAVSTANVHNSRSTETTMLDRRILLASVASLFGLAAFRWLRMTPAQAAEKFEIEKTDAEWRAQLTPQQYDILRKEGTERPGSSPLLKEHRKGIFACAGCDLPLFSSETKFESGTGWPSF